MAKRVATREERDGIVLLRQQGVPYKDIKARYPHIPIGSLRRIVHEEKHRGPGKDDEMPPSGERTEYVEEGNHAFIVNVSANIKTEEQMVNAIEADLSRWRRTKWSARCWQQTAKIQIDGEWKLVKSDQWYSRIDFLPITPVAITPVVQPVEIRASLREGAKAEATPADEVQTALLLADPQFGFRRDLRTGHLEPFHDRQALDVALQIARGFVTDQIIWLGDMLDLPDWTDRFIRSPDFYWSTQAAVIEAAWWLAQFRQAAPEAEIVVMEGNHDKRMEKALCSHLSAAYQLRPADELELPPALTIPRLLALDSMGIRYVGDYPNGEEWLGDSVVCVHGDLVRQPGYTAPAYARESDVTMIFGHTHRREWAARTLHGRRSRRVIDSFSPGCLCRIDGVVPAKRGKRLQWQQGIALVRYAACAYNIMPVAINDGLALCATRVYRATDQLPALREDTGWDF